MDRNKVKQVFQQFLIAVVVFSLICPGLLHAKKEKPGVYLIITKIDGQQVKGELLQVKDDSSLLLISETPASITKVSISINEIENIKVKKKSKNQAGGLIVGAAGIGFGVLLSSISLMGTKRRMLVVAIAGGMGLLVGSILGSGTYYKTYEVRGKLPSEKKDILNKLKKKARFKE